MGFDFQHTCGDINLNISLIKETIKDEITDLVQELSPLYYTAKESEDFIETVTNNLYRSLEDYIENIRCTNANIREVAEDKINELEEELSENKAILDELNARVKIKSKRFG